MSSSQYLINKKKSAPSKPKVSESGRTLPSYNDLEHTTSGVYHPVESKQKITGASFHSVNPTPSAQKNASLHQNLSTPSQQKVTSHSHLYKGDKPSGEFKKRYSLVVEELDRINSVTSDVKQGVDAEAVIVEGYGTKKDVETQYREEDLRASTYYLLSCFSFLCCPLFSIFALRASCKVKRLRRLKDNDTARSYSKMSLTCGTIAVFCGMAMYIALIFVLMKSNLAVWFNIDIIKKYL